ncbi:MAG: trypsin-like peptidase domain-containing protein [Gammaproteobacteria bacterium]|nr:trypsin-like peptidase domain-containing protein [Gammaproteobacteria bacterium]
MSPTFTKRIAGRPAGTFILFLLTFTAAACTGPPGGRGPVQLRFAQSASPHFDMEILRVTAESASRSYVKLVVMNVVMNQASPRRNRGHEPGPEIITGASGVIVDPAGYVVTAAHIAKSTSLEARVTTVDGRVYPARILKVDAERELALLQIEGTGTRFAAVRPASGARRNQPVFAIGTPGNRPGAVSVGHVTDPALGRRVGYGEYGFQGPIQLALRVEPGHSGGPVFDMDGELVGMIFAFDLENRDGEYVNTGAAYAIPARDVMRFILEHSPGSGNF